MIMKTAAVICELNPAHNGHKYVFDEIKKRSGADHLIALMSGNYVQRGEPALLDKYIRTRMALMMGADLVLELPSPFSFQSAREFAIAGVSLAAASGIIDVLGFGAEFPNETLSNNNADCVRSFSDMLKEAAAILLEEPPAYKEALKSELKKGVSYPLASEQGLKACGIEAADIISSPNNILAREYLRAILLISKKSGCSRSFSSSSHDNRDYFSSAGIETLIIPRIGDGYNDDIPKDTRFASATALRRLLLSGASLNDIKAYIPTELYGIYEDIAAGSFSLLSPDDISDVLSLRLLSQIYEVRSANLFDVPEELYNRIMKDAERPLSFTERAMEVKTKGYTYTRISRALLNLSLGVTEKEVSELKAESYVTYIRILGFRRQASGLLSSLKEKASVPVISNAASGRDILGSSVFYDNIYYSLMASARKRMGNSFKASDSFAGSQDSCSAASLTVDTKAIASSVRNEYERQIVII